MEIDGKQLEVYHLIATFTWGCQYPAVTQILCSLPIQVCILSFVLNGSEAEFSSRVDEFEHLIGGSLYIAVEKHILLYYSVMVADIQEETEGTIK